MKLPTTIPPPTPAKRRLSTAHRIPDPSRKQIAEGSFYRIYSTEVGTVLRVSKRPSESLEEVEILRRVEHAHVNRMLRWGVEDGMLHFEMEKCDFSLESRGDLLEKIFRRGVKRVRVEDSSLEEASLEAGSGGNSLEAPKESKSGELKSSSLGIGNDNLASESWLMESSPLITGELESKPEDIFRPDELGLLTTERPSLVNTELSKTPHKTPRKSNKNEPFPLILPTEVTEPTIADPFSNTIVPCSTSIIISDDSSDSCQCLLSPLAIPYWLKIMMYQVSAALAHAHARNVVHMDVKPENILVKDSDTNPTFQLCDFNIARVGEGPFSLDGDKVYMAPEILNGRCFFKSDVFSLGLVYLEIANERRLPTSGEAYRRLRRNNFEGWMVDEIGRRMLERDPVGRCSSKDVEKYFRSLLNEG